MDKIKSWVLGLVMSKGVKSAAKLLVSFAVAHGIKLTATIAGIAINTTDEAAMVVAINSALKQLFAWIKGKYQGKFDWLP